MFNNVTVFDAVTTFGMAIITIMFIQINAKLAQLVSKDVCDERHKAVDENKKTMSSFGKRMGAVEQRQASVDGKTSD